MNSTTFFEPTTNNVTHFLKIIQFMSSLNCHRRFSIFLLETLKFEWQCSQYLELNPTCIKGRLDFLACLFCRLHAANSSDSPLVRHLLTSSWSSHFNSHTCQQAHNPLRRRTLSVLFTIVTTSYQTTCTSILGLLQ